MHFIKGRMGLDGVVPGTAYTLLTPADSSFAVDLVQNLNLSSQKVSTALQALAEKDPKWSRIRHITAGISVGMNDTKVLILDNSMQTIAY